VEEYGEEWTKMSLIFKRMVLSGYKGYGNELWKKTFRVPCGEWIQILSAYDL
jgi:hypothetical protein